MIDHNVVYASHPLYKHFTRWGGLEDTDESYVMINTSLYAAESYILNRLGVNLTAKVYSDKLPLGATETRFNHFPSALLSILKSNKLLLPNVDYFSTSKNSFESYVGDYYLDGNSAIFQSVQSKVTINYLSGYIAKEIVDYDDTVGGSPVDTTAPSKPIVKNTDDTQVESPVITNGGNYTVVVKGEAGSKVIINEADSGNVVGANGEVTIVLTVDKDTNVYRISLMDATDNVSDVSKVFIIKANNDEKPNLVVLGHEIVSKGAQIKCVVYLSMAGDIEIDGNVVGTFNKGVSTIELPVGSTNGKVNYNRLNLKVGTSKSSTSVIPYMYNTSLDELLVEEMNTNRLNIPYMPMELMTAFFRLAQHLYHGTLYKDDNIGRYSAGTSKSVSFTSHRIPKDILNILHSYIAY